jgi:hypothetical protein
MIGLHSTQLCTKKSGTSPKIWVERSVLQIKLSELYQKLILLNPLNIIKIISFIDITNLKSVQQMADLERIMKFQKQSEVDLLNQGKKNRQIMAISSAVSAILVFY